MMSDLTCSVCGGASFTDHQVLWTGLVSEWQLAPHEHAYVDRQQGTKCAACGANLRSIALANAIRDAVGTRMTLREFVKTSEACRLAVLEINEAGNLSPILQQLPGHTLAAYPAIDMRAMPYPSDAFDLVIHSDTLEHIANPIRALSECRRVLRPGAALCFTIPTIVERLSRSREGLAKSYHGNSNEPSDDYMVHTEFGADMWTFVIRAGFSALTINAVDYPAAIALSARKDTLGNRGPTSTFPDAGVTAMLGFRNWNGRLGRWARRRMRLISGLLRATFLSRLRFGSAVQS